MMLGERTAMPRLTRRRFLLQAGFDAACWVPALWIAAIIRYDLVIDRVPVEQVAVLCALAVVLQFVIGRSVGLYVHRWRYATFEEVAAMALSGLLTAAALTAIDLLPHLGRPVPLSTTISGGLLAILGMAIGRFLWRIWLERLSTI